LLRVSFVLLIVCVTDIGGMLQPWHKAGRSLAAGQSEKEDVGEP